MPTLKGSIQLPETTQSACTRTRAWVQAGAGEGADHIRPARWGNPQPPHPHEGAGPTHSIITPQGSDQVSIEDRAAIPLSPRWGPCGHGVISLPRPWETQDPIRPRQGRFPGTKWSPDPTNRSKTRPDANPGTGQHLSLFHSRAKGAPMMATPYIMPLGFIHRRTGDGAVIMLTNPEDSWTLQLGTLVTVWRYSRRRLAAAKARGQHHRRRIRHRHLHHT